MTKVNAAVSHLLVEKIKTVEKALLLARKALDCVDEERSTLPTQRLVIKELLSFDSRIHANPLVSQKRPSYRANELVFNALAHLHPERSLGLEDWLHVEWRLSEALEKLYEVYRIEEPRSRIYERKGAPQPQKSGSNARKK